MTANGAAILSSPQPCGHIVYPYTDENQMAQAVCLFASAGLLKGEAVLLVMTKHHCEPIRRGLAAEGFNVEALMGKGLLVCEDAEDLLATFMVGGMPDERLFKAKIGGMIEKAKARSGSRPNRPVRVFGEMVTLIWEVNPNATQRLEELWNEVIQEHSVPLLCAYALAGSKLGALPQSIMACHSHAVA